MAMAAPNGIHSSPISCSAPQLCWIRPSLFEDGLDSRSPIAGQQWDLLLGDKFALYAALGILLYLGTLTMRAGV